MNAHSNKTSKTLTSRFEQIELSVFTEILFLCKPHLN